ncbi:MAG TPA: hotdog fold thioesterase [Labilithrix sp.]|nr:hotdog fold thioesterase [Labilithrix sp.]
MSPEVLRQVMEELIPFNRYLGVKLVETREGYARLEVPFRDELVGDPMRPALHGGVLSALADTAGGAAVWTGLADAHARVSTIDLRIDYLRPARLVTVVAEATVVRLGNRVGVADVRLYNADAPDVTIATGKGVYNIMIKKGSH